MELNSIERSILESYYRLSYEDEFDYQISTDQFDLSEDKADDKVKETGYYLKKLEHNGFLEFKYNPKPFLTGGHNHERYRNNISMINWDCISLTYKGKITVEELRITKWDKLKSSVTNFFKDIMSEIRAKVISHIASFVLGFIAALIYIRFLT